MSTQTITAADVLAAPGFRRVVTITSATRHRMSLTSDAPTFFLTVTDGNGWTGRVCWADYLPREADMLDARTLGDFTARTPGEDVTILYTPGEFPITASTAR